jgi:glycosyltransferase involved in cell wall biosynthesis
LTRPPSLPATPFQLHVGFVVNNFPPHIGGVQQHVFALSSELVRLGAKVTVATLGPVPGRPSYPGIDIIEVKGTPAIGGVMAWPYPGTSAKLVKEFRARGVNVISVHTRFFPFTFIGVRMARHLGVPSILTEHGSDFVRGVSPLVSACSKIVDLSFGRYALRRADRVLAISSATEQFVRRLAKVSSSIFFNAIHTADFRPETAENKPPRKVVFLGRLVPGKGWERIFDVANALAGQYPELEIHVVGDGPDRERAQESAQESGASERITIHGFLDAGQFRGILANSILLNPTTLAEGFQTTLLEAVAAGASIVSTRVAAAEFLSALGAPIVLKEYADTAGWISGVQALLQSPAPGVDEALLKEFDWDSRAQQFLSLATDLASGSR